MFAFISLQYTLSSNTRDRQQKFNNNGGSRELYTVDRRRFFHGSNRKCVNIVSLLRHRKFVWEPEKLQKVVDEHLHLLLER